MSKSGINSLVVYKKDEHKLVSIEKLIKKAKILRMEYQKECEGFEWDDIEVGSVEERYIQIVDGGEPTRILIYRPLSAFENTGHLPLYISIHGGAFIRGSADFDDHFCRRTANDSECMVINVDFKLAPEYKFPYSVEECYRVLVWSKENAEHLGIDPDRIAVGGHNTGGTIAEVVAQLARDRGEANVACMLLDGPVISLAGDNELQDFDLETPLTGSQKGAFFNTCYLGDPANASSPMASPACLENLDGMPDAFILIAGEDPQASPTEYYAERLKESGVDVESARFEGCKHGFTIRSGLASPDDVDRAWVLMNNYLKRKLHCKPK